MPLDAKTIAQLAEHLENCELQTRDTPKITDDHPDMDWDDAYAIQDAILARKLARGARIVGYKAGLTSHAKMKQMNVESPVFGFLVDYFSVLEGAAIKVSDLIHPKVEPETHDLEHGLAHLRVIEVEVRLMTEEAVPEILPRYRIPRPV